MRKLLTILGIFTSLFTLQAQSQTQANEAYKCVRLNTPDRSVFDISIEHRIVQIPYIYENGVPTRTTPEKITYFVVKHNGEVVAETPARDFATDKMTIGIIKSKSISNPELNVFAFDRKELKLFVGYFFIKEDNSVNLHGMGQNTYVCQPLKKP